MLGAEDAPCGIHADQVHGEGVASAEFADLSDRGTGLEHRPHRNVLDHRVVQPPQARQELGRDPTLSPALFIPRLPQLVPVIGKVMKRYPVSGVT